MYTGMHSKSNILRAISWRIFGTAITILLVFLFTRKIDLALIVGGIEILVKMIFYHFHEQVWSLNRVPKNQLPPTVIWFTGLSGSGKSTLAEKTFHFLEEKGYNVERLDGDIVRSIFPGLSFSKEDRNRHIKRVGFLSSLLEKNGVIVIAAFISPYEEARQFVRKKCNNFVEVFLDTSLEECERRDVKGLYEKARSGEIKNFTGISDPYEKPVNPDLMIKTDNQTVDESFNRVIDYLKEYWRCKKL